MVVFLFPDTTQFQGKACNFTLIHSSVLRPLPDEIKKLGSPAL